MVDKSGSVVSLVPCWFFVDVVCSKKRGKGSRVLDCCFSCDYYVQFEKEMDEADAKDDEFAEWALAHPDAYLRGGVS